jgi:hypothetical protein
MSFGAKTSGYRQHEIMCQNTMLVGVLLSHQTAIFDNSAINLLRDIPVLRNETKHALSTFLLTSRALLSAREHHTAGVLFVSEDVSGRGHVRI